MSTLNQIKVEDTLYDIEDKQARDELGDKANKNEIPSIVGLATEEYVNNAIENIEIPECEPVDLTGYATEEYVNDVFANLSIGEGGSNAFTLKQTLEEEANGTSFILPTKWENVLMFNVHINIPSDFTADIKLTLELGKKYRNMGTIEANTKGFNMFALRCFTGSSVRFVYGQEKASNAQEYARPIVGGEQLSATSDKNTYKLYSTNDVMFPVGTVFEMWGVCT